MSKNRNMLVAKYKANCVSTPQQMIQNINNLEVVDVIDYKTGKRIGKYTIKDFLRKFR